MFGLNLMVPDQHWGFWVSWSQLVALPIIANTSGKLLDVVSCFIITIESLSRAPVIYILIWRFEQPILHVHAPIMKLKMRDVLILCKRENNSWEDQSHPPLNWWYCGATKGLLPRQSCVMGIVWSDVDSHLW